ncbi:hypothetical protein KM043_003486 [Ampulex compressa]|nr:hypothetical protein KM043_003486 [Ampulex compressa]
MLLNATLPTNSISSTIPSQLLNIVRHTEATTHRIITSRTIEPIYQHHATQRYSPNQLHQLHYSKPATQYRTSHRGNDIQNRSKRAHRTDLSASCYSTDPNAYPGARRLAEKWLTTPPGPAGRGLSPRSIKPPGIHFHRTFTRRFVTHLLTMRLLILAGLLAVSLGKETVSSVAEKTEASGNADDIVMLEIDVKEPVKRSPVSASGYGAAPSQFVIRHADDAQEAPTAAIKITLGGHCPKQLQTPTVAIKNTSDRHCPQHLQAPTIAIKNTLDGHCPKYLQTPTAAIKMTLCGHYPKHLQAPTIAIKNTSAGHCPKQLQTPKIAIKNTLDGHCPQHLQIPKIAIKNTSAGHCPKHLQTPAIIED